MIIKGFSFLLFLYESICCGYSLESPHRGVDEAILMSTHNAFLWRNVENYP